MSKPLGLSEGALAIATERPKLWEHRLFAQVILDEIAVGQGGECAPPDVEPIQFSALGLWSSQKLEEFVAIAEELASLVNMDHEDAFGPPGKPGDASTIVELARKIGAYHRRAIKWADAVRCTPVNSAYAELPRLLAQQATALCHGLEAFGRTLLEQIDDALSAPTQGGPRTINAALSVDLVNSDRLRQELGRLGAALDAYRATNDKRGFARIVGQEDAIRRLRAFAELYRNNGRVPGHVLLIGPDGHGKRLIAHAFAEEYGGSIRDVPSGSVARPGDLAAILTNLDTGDVLVMLNANRLSSVIIESLSPMLKTAQIDVEIGKGPSLRRIALDLKAFTVVGTVPKETDCPPELRDCFSLVMSLAAYSQTELAQIALARAQANGIDLTPATARLVADLGKGSPHEVEGLVQRLMFAGVSPVAEEVAAITLSTFGFRPPSGGNSPGLPDNLDELSGVEFERLVRVSLHRDQPFRHRDH